MIYKFSNDGIDLEIELIQEKEGGIVLEENTVFSMKHYQNSDEWISINLDKKDVYRFIGALHLLHKEMK
jgi:hypothetical protein